MISFPQTIGVRETESQIEIGRLSVNVINERVQIVISDGLSTFSTSIHLLPVDAATVAENIKQAIQLIIENRS